MGINFKTNVVQATGMKMYYRIPSKEGLPNNKMKPILRCVYVDTLDVKEAFDTVMEECTRLKKSSSSLFLHLSKDSSHDRH